MRLAELCSKNPSCLGDGYSLLITAPNHGSIGLALTVPGIALVAKGYGAPSDVQPGRSDFIYVSAEQYDPRRGG